MNLDAIQERLRATELPNSATALSEFHSELLEKMEKSTDTAISIGNELLNTVGLNTPGSEVSTANVLYH